MSISRTEFLPVCATVLAAFFMSIVTLHIVSLKFNLYIYTTKEAIEQCPDQLEKRASIRCVFGYLAATLGYLGIDTSKEGNAWACFGLLLFLILGIFMYIKHVLKEIDQYKEY